MEINGIPSNASTPPVATKPAALTPTKSKETPPQHDTVTLSGAALAKSLKQSGLTAAQIALKMHLSVETVDQYLGIATKAVTTTSPPPTTPAPQVK
jgi:DNA-binding NarL/FixJ family response regulator